MSLQKLMCVDPSLVIYDIRLAPYILHGIYRDCLYNLQLVSRGKARVAGYTLELGTLSKRESIKMGCYWHFATALCYGYNGILDPSKIC